jgi:ankyrin repeat protein
MANHIIVSDERLEEEFESIQDTLKVGRVDKAKLKNLINLKTEDGLTILYIAADEGDFKVFQELIKAGADVNAVTKDGVTVLHAAAAGGNSIIFNELVKAGLDIHAVTKDGATVLHAAAAGGNPTIFNELVKAGLDINAVTKDGDSVLAIAIDEEHQELAQIIESYSNYKVLNINKATFVDHSTYDATSYMGAHSDKVVESEI